MSEGRRREFASFGWQPEDVSDPQSPETFLRSRLIALRRRGPSVGTGVELPSDSAVIVGRAPSR